MPDTLNNVAVAVFVPEANKFSDCVPGGTLDQTLTFAENAGRGGTFGHGRAFPLVSGHEFTVRDADASYRVVRCVVAVKAVGVGGMTRPLSGP